MFTVIILMSAGIFTGYLLRNKEFLARHIGIIITWLIYMLLFLLGISVGTNNDIISNLDEIGLDAMLITAGALSGSVIAAWITYRFFFRKYEE